MISSNSNDFQPGSSTWMCALLLPLFALAACTTPEQLNAQKEDHLAAAGFVQLPANTAARQKMLNQLPPHRLLATVRGNTVTYAYADPNQCACLYIGTQQAYGRYRAAMERRELTDKRLLTAQIYSDAQWNWDPWGPWNQGFYSPGLTGFGW